MASTETVEQVHKAGNERLYPSLANPSWLILRKRRELFRRWLSTLPGTDWCVLDVGGRIQPYRLLLGGKCARYFAVDLRPTPLLDAVAKAEQLPFPSQVFDMVFCTQVLEYLPDPQAAVGEIHRTLKPGGFVLLSVPAVFPRDSQIEYWRFLPAAVEKLLSGFSRVELAPEGNSLVGLIRTVNVGLIAFSWPAANRLLRYSLVPVLNLAGALLESLVRSKDDRFTANFSAWAQK